MSNENVSPILVVGSPRDPTYLHTIRSFAARKFDFKMLDIDAFCRSGYISGSLAAPESLLLHGPESTWRLADFRSCYARFVDLPADWEGDAGKDSAQALQLAISALKILVVNRPLAGGSNSSKPYQTDLLRQHGFTVPRSCSTNSPKVAASFINDLPDGVIYKSNSAHRSIVQPVRTSDYSRLDLIQGCPVFFQERIRGIDVRVHVIQNSTFSVEIRSSEVDYRYDRSLDITEAAHELDTAVAAKCIAITRSIGLTFSGIDFIRSDEDDQYYCLEVNPMPGYHGYDLTLGGQISRRLGDLLASPPSSVAPGWSLPVFAERVMPPKD